MSFTEELHTRGRRKSQLMHSSGGRSRRGRGKRSVIRGGGAQPTKPKPTFWQRVIAFFKGPQVAVPPKPVERPVQDGATKEKISRKPELVEVTSPKLYVGNLSFDATESDLFDLFNGIGQVRNPEEVSHKTTHPPTGLPLAHITTLETPI